MRTGNIFLVSAITKVVKSNKEFLRSASSKTKVCHLKISIILSNCNYDSFLKEQGQGNEMETTRQGSNTGTFFTRLLKVIVKALNLTWFTDPVFLLMLASE